MCTGREHNRGGVQAAAGPLLRAAAARAVDVAVWWLQRGGGGGRGGWLARAHTPAAVPQPGLLLHRDRGALPCYPDAVMRWTSVQHLWICSVHG